MAKQHLIKILALWIILTCSVQAALEVHLSMNDGQGTIVTDLSGNHRDAQMMNMSDTQWGGGIVDGGLYFDGQDDYLNVTGYKGIAGPDSRTVMAWIKPEGVEMTIAYWGTVSTSAKWRIWINEAGLLRCEVEGGYIMTTQSVSDGQWHHVAVVLDNDGSANINEVKLYVDGKEATTASGARAINTVLQDDVFIGVGKVRDGQSPRFFKGWLDDVRIYSEAVSAQDISDIADVEIPEEKLPNLYWACNDGSGNILTEESVDSYDGIINADQSTVWTEGKFSGGIALNGYDEYIRIVGFNGILADQERTCAMWVKTLSGTGTLMSWGSYNGAAGQRWRFWMQNGNLRCEVEGGYVLSDDRINDGKWHHVAAVLPDTEEGYAASVHDIILYIDGKPATASYGNDVGISTVSSDEVVIGVTVRPGGNEIYFSGAMDEIKLFPKGLTVEEISDMYREPLQSVSPVEGGIIMDTSAFEMQWTEASDSIAYDIYLAEDWDDLNKANSETHLNVHYQRVTTNSVTVDPCSLAYGTLYWRVDTILENDLVWGDVWQFNYETCDGDFVPMIESFDSVISDAWLGVYWPFSGGGDSRVNWDEFKGYNHTGSSVLLTYDTTVEPYQTEIKRSFCSLQNWDPDIYQVLRLYYYGDCDNNDETLYVCVQDENGTVAQVVYDGDEGLIQPEDDIQWRCWEIELSQLAAQGLELDQIKSLAIGVRRNGAGGIGRVYIDQIQLSSTPLEDVYPVSVDINRDGIVDILDLLILAGDWLERDGSEYLAMAPDSSKLIVHYPFDEISGNIADDISTNNFNANISYGDPELMWDTNGYLGGCLRLTGDYQTSPLVVIPADSLTIIEHEFTIGFWLWLDHDAVSPYTVIDTYPIDIQHGDGLGLRLRGTEYLWGKRRDDTLRERWNHLAFSFNDVTSAVRMYLNGVKVTEQEMVITLDDLNIMIFMLGRRIPQSSDWYSGGITKGALDEFRMYAYELSQQEILNLANKTNVIQYAISEANFDMNEDVDLNDFKAMVLQWLDTSM